MIKIQSFKSRAAVLIGLVFFVGALQASPITYTYTGNSFTYQSGSYTTQNFIHATFTLDEAMGANLSRVSLAPTSFDVSDGVQTFTDQSPGLGTEMFMFWTDAFGTIVHWNLAVGVDRDFIETSNVNSGVLDFSHLDTGVKGTGYNENSSGTWAITASTAVPEPASILLVACALLAAAVGHRSGRRRAA